MAELSIKVNIANRVYPLKVTLEEEENIRKAAKMINERVKEYGENFSVRDNQDLLAMCALQFVNESLQASGKQESQLGNLDEEISDMDKLITASINELSE